MSEPFIGEIKLVSFAYPPKGWAFCNGQTLLIQQNVALFSLLGITYGGDGRSTFALPDLQGRVPIHPDNNQFLQGQQGGEAAHTLTLGEMPAHRHSLSVVSSQGNKNTPSKNLPASAPTGLGNVYGAATDLTPFADTAVSSTRNSGDSHSNLQPYLTLNFVIALEGIFPSRN